MSTARHHNEWLSLLEISGPFLSLPALLRVFPQGLEPADTELTRDLRIARSEWESADTSALHLPWIRFVLKKLLDLSDEVLVEDQAVPQTLSAKFDTYHETLRPDFAVLSPKDGDTPRTPRLLISVYPKTQSLDRPIAKQFWKDSPATRMMELLHATNVRVGLITNGEQWMLVDAPKDQTTGFISWYSSLWLEEPITLRAFCSLLSTNRFFGVADDQTLEAMLQESASSQQELTDQLGLQVRKAVEVLIQSLDKIDRERKRELLRGVNERELYEAALTIMMRLVFLLSSEEQNPPFFPIQNPFYSDHYAISTLRAQLREAADQYGEEVLERRYDAWSRLLATFRMIFGGAYHEDLMLPAHGGSLFDPDRFPFLEGRAAGSKWADTPALPLPIHNRTVLHLLEALQILQVRVPGGGPAEARKLSYRALDIENIGHVYEGLLDHTAVRAKTAVLGLSGSNEPEIEVVTLEAQQKKSKETLLAFLKEQTGRSEKALQKSLDTPPDELRLLSACENDAGLYKRVKPFAGLVREDTARYPVVIPEGSFYVTQGTDRRSTGTHYTPKSLTEPIVEYTLEPLVYEGPSEGKPKSEWKLKSPREILSLRVCDMAMGSGAFLVQACRYLSLRLVESWSLAEQSASSVIPRLDRGIHLAPVPSPSSSASPSVILGQALARPGDPSVVPVKTGWYGTPAQNSQAIVSNSLDSRLRGNDEQKDGKSGEVRISPEGALSTGALDEKLLPIDPDERMTLARRLIAERCLYGVDKNPLAVEMAKLSMWLVTRQKDRAFTFLDHALRCGDSLLGLTSAAQLEYFHIDPKKGEGLNQLFHSKVKEVCREAMQRAIDKRRQLESFTVNDVRDAAQKESLLRDSSEAIADLKIVADLLIGAALSASGKALDSMLEMLAPEVLSLLDGKQSKANRAEHRSTLQHRARTMLQKGKPADQAERKPFHWVLEFPEVFVEGTTVQRGFHAFLGNPPFIGGKKITGPLGTDYRDYLVEYVAAGAKGSADLCAYFFLRAGELLREGGNTGLIATNSIAQGDTREVGLEQLVKNGCCIPRAVPSRKWPGEANLEVAHVWMYKGSWEGPFTLDEKDVSSITAFLVESGSGLGTPQQLVENEGMSHIGALILGTGFLMSPEDAQLLLKKNPKNKEVLFPYLNGEDLNSRPDQSPRRWVINFKDWPLDQTSAPKDYKGPVAADYPDCLAIVREKVKPERDGNNRKIYKENWWQFGEKQKTLYRMIEGMPRVLVKSEVGNKLSFEFVPNGWIYSHMLIVVATYQIGYLAVLQSNIHELWAREYGSSLRNDLRYTPSDCFETFPFPSSLGGLEDVGERYYKHRQQVMVSSQLGLTKTYNRFHNPDEKSADIQKLRELHVEMDYAVAAAYGWSDLKLEHDFHTTKQGVRYTISETARKAVLAKLLKLNHDRYEEEVKQGLHEKKSTKSKIKETATASAPSVGGEGSGEVGFSLSMEETPKPKKSKKK